MQKGLVYMKQSDKKSSGENEKNISHENVLWLIFRALSENVEIKKEIIKPK